MKDKIKQDVNEAIIAELEGAMQEFCERRESGEVRSSFTYGKFRRLLDKKARLF